MPIVGSGIAGGGTELTRRDAACGWATAYKPAGAGALESGAAEPVTGTLGTEATAGDATRPASGPILSESGTRSLGGGAGGGALERVRGIAANDALPSCDFGGGGGAPVGVDEAIGAATNGFSTATEGLAGAG